MISDGIWAFQTFGHLPCGHDLTDSIQFRRQAVADGSQAVASSAQTVVKRMTIATVRCAAVAIRSP